MSLSISRVVVVSVFALSLNIATVPAAQAKPHESGRVNSSASSRSWLDAAVNWLNEFLGRQVKNSDQGLKKVIAGDGGQCIDPWGNPKPCS
jgi:hypothetical protein